MEQVLIKMARQLDSLDEASLSGLWDKYAHFVNDFEPTQRWQEAVLVLSFIQAKRWKNQLFNTKWAARTRLDAMNARDAQDSKDVKNAKDGIARQDVAPLLVQLELDPEKSQNNKPKARVLQFKSKQE